MLSPAPPHESGSPPVTRADITAAAERLAPHTRRTPLLDVGAGRFGLDPSVGLTLKLELTQHTGSFKPRGALNRVLSGATIPPAGLAAASGGNHGQAVAWVGGRFELPATVFVPEVSSPLKRQRIAGYGAVVVVEGAQYDDAQAACDAFVAETGALKIHPYDDVAVVAGQGTVGRELAEQAPHLDTVLVACGGGGLIGGVAAWYSGRGVKVVSVEPSQSCCLAAALAAGAPTPVSVAGLAADSLGARRLGDVAWQLVRDGGVAEALTVPDEAISDARRALWDECRIAAEAGGATALAALTHRVYVPAPGEQVGVVVCGGNVELSSW